MKDVAILNQMAVNRAAADMLRSLGKKPDPDCLHCLELVFWAIECGDGETEKAIVETLHAMATWRPQRIMNFLDLLPGQEYHPAGWESARTPVEFAYVVLKDMEERMFVKFPWYGSLEG